MLAALLAGCDDPNTFVEPPAPKVTIAEPLVQDVTDYLEFTGTTESSAAVEVRARVAGVLESMNFEPGTDIEAGDILFVIDRDVYEAEVQGADAALAQAVAGSDLATATLARVQQAGEAVSQTQVEETAAQARTAEAKILASKAELRQAEINLSYTDVEAPISGRVGRNLVDVGNLVGEGEATVLTDVTAYDPMYVYFNMNERDLLRVLGMFRERAAEKSLDSKDTAAEAEILVDLALADEEGYPHQGVLDYTDSSVDPATGTITLRGTFPNEEWPPTLIPGLFARVRMPIAERADLPLVTERAIGSDQSGQYVLVVNQENVVEKRNVRLGQLIDGLRVIEDGVESGERIVVNGIQRARPGATIDPEMADMTAFTASAMRAAAPDAATDSDEAPAEAETEPSGSDAEVPDAASEPPEAEPKDAETQG
jgi:RND family efflux transporter MFP subunit